MSEQQEKNWHEHTDGEGFVWLSLDTAGSDTNVLNHQVIRELEGILARLGHTPPAGVAITSAKPGGFIAGADVKAFTQLAGKEEALKLIQRGQGLMDRIEALPCPTVAVINGYCLGGGLELALACNYRVALDDPKTRLALPEVKLGIHPGFGGSVRTIRQVGVLAAMDLMLTGRGIDARQAKKIGLVDHAVPERQLKNAALGVLRNRPSSHRPPLLPRLAGHRLLRPLVARQLRQQVAAKAPKEHYPAPYALIDLWERHADDPKRMYLEEARSVAQLIIGETAQNLVRVFQLQTRLKGLGNKHECTPRHVHVVGSGIMGGDIAAWCALQGLNVSVQDSHPKALAQTLQRAHQLFAKRFRGNKNLATAALDRLTPDPKGHGLVQADVVIEAIVEDQGAKEALFKAIEPRLKADAILATNTSSIPLERLAAALKEPARLVGLHFFNPVAQMPLLEIVHGAHTDATVVARALAFARHIDKLPLPVRSSPGFLVNRILMPYLLEAVILEQEGVPKEAIDQAATAFGMPMGPLELADTVGLDICLHVGTILGRELGMAVPSRLQGLVDTGSLGRKSGQGFYEWADGKPIQEKPTPSPLERQEIQDRLILRMLNEAVACLREGLVEDADLVDAGIIFGTGFAPFRGGPMHYIERQRAENLKARLDELARQHGDRFAPDIKWAQ